MICEDWSLAALPWYVTVVSRMWWWWCWTGAPYSHSFPYLFLALCNWSILGFVIHHLPSSPINPWRIILALRRKAERSAPFNRDQEAKTGFVSLGKGHCLSYNMTHTLLLKDWQMRPGSMRWEHALSAYGMTSPVWAVWLLSLLLLLSYTRLGHPRSYAGELLVFASPYIQRPFLLSLGI